jgi:hypothetical protein
METKQYQLVLPEGYERKELPYFNEWIAALESDEYKQGYHKLFDTANKSYCCLGVLSKVQGRLTEDGCDSNNVLKAILDVTNPCYGMLDGSGSFPEGVSIKYGWSHLRNLTRCNDSGMTFKEIANIIKQIWKSE